VYLNSERRYIPGLARWGGRVHRDQVRGSCPPGANPPLHTPPPWGRWGSARSHWVPARARCGNTLALRDRKQSVVLGRSTGHAGDPRSTCWIAPLVTVTRGLVRSPFPLSCSVLGLGFAQWSRGLLVRHVAEWQSRQDGKGLRSHFSVSLFFSSDFLCVEIFV